jgi:hypothetical protein
VFVSNVFQRFLRIGAISARRFSRVLREYFLGASVTSRMLRNLMVQEHRKWTRGKAGLTGNPIP